MALPPGTSCLPLRSPSTRPSLHITLAIAEYTNAMQAALSARVRWHSRASQQPTPRLGKSIDAPSYLPRCYIPEPTLRESELFSQKLPCRLAVYYNPVPRIHSQEISCPPALPTHLQPTHLASQRTRRNVEDRQKPRHNKERKRLLREARSIHHLGEGGNLSRHRRNPYRSDQTRDPTIKHLHQQHLPSRLLQ